MIHFKNKIIRKWIKKFCSEQVDHSIVIAGIPTNVLIMVNEVESSPIGLGQDEFFIDQGFLLKVALKICYELLDCRIT